MEFISNDILNYCEHHSSPEPELLQRLNRDTHARVLNPRMLSGHLQGRFLSAISKMIQPSCILEIGTYTGYSALCLCEGLSADGKLITIDINDELEEFSAAYFFESGRASQIEQKTGNATDILPTLPYTYDLVFIDADKREYIHYFNMVIDKVRPGGFIIADNVLWSGHVLKSPEQQDEDTRAISDFNTKIQSDSRVEVCMLPLRDGLSIIQKK